jgi:hypothetical protein
MHHAPPPTSENSTVGEHGFGAGAPYNETDSYHRVQNLSAQGTPKALTCTTLTLSLADTGFS